MTPDEAVDAAMRGPFEDSHDGEQLDPPTPEVADAMRSLLRSLIAARPALDYTLAYDAMAGLIVYLEEGGADVSVSILNGGFATLHGPSGGARVAVASVRYDEANTLVQGALERLDRVAAFLKLAAEAAPFEVAGLMAGSPARAVTERGPK